MEQSIFAWHDFHEASVRHDGAYCSFVYLAYFRYGNDGANLGDSLVDAFLVRCAYLNLALAVGFVDGYCRSRLFLNLLYDLSARTDYGSYEFLRNVESLDAWHLWLQFCTWLCYGVSQLAEDVLAAFLCLHECFFEDFEAQSVTLDVHLCGCESVLCTGGLEVHVA